MTLISQNIWVRSTQLHCRTRSPTISLNSWSRCHWWEGDIYFQKRRLSPAPYDGGILENERMDSPNHWRSKAIRVELQMLSILPEAIDAFLWEIIDIHYAHSERFRSDWMKLESKTGERENRSKDANIAYRIFLHPLFHTRHASKQLIKIVIVHSQWDIVCKFENVSPSTWWRPKIMKRERFLMPHKYVSLTINNQWCLDVSNLSLSLVLCSVDWELP